MVAMFFFVFFFPCCCVVCPVLMRLFRPVAVFDVRGLKPLKPLKVRSLRREALYKLLVSKTSKPTKKQQLDPQNLEFRYPKPLCFDRFGDVRWIDFLFT